MDTDWRSRWRPLVRHAVDSLVQVVYPPLCVICRVPIDQHGLLCPDCWTSIHFLDGPLCDQCGIPFDHDLFEGALCAACTANPPAFQKARAAFIYNDASKALILAFKHGDRTELVPVLSNWLERVVRELAQENPLLVPVPLHWRRRLTRQFNQSAELARTLGYSTGLETSMSLLERRVHGPSQGAMSRRARQKNVAGVFRVRPANRAQVEGRAVILVDDVLTTGATANACAKALLKEGAARVDVVTLARVALPSQVRI